MNDRDDIQELMIRYGTAIDGRDFPLLRRCFTPDAIVRFAAFAGELKGGDELETYIRKAVSELDATHHMFMNFVVTTDGERGQFTCSVQAQHIVNDAPGGHFFTVGGDYRNGVVRTAGGWVMDSLDFKPVWTAGNPALVHHEPVTSGA